LSDLILQVFFLHAVNCQVTFAFCFSEGLSLPYICIIEVFPFHLVNRQVTFFAGYPGKKKTSCNTLCKSPYEGIIGGFLFCLVNWQVTFADPAKIVP
jgi:hypothetical protein